MFNKDGAVFITAVGTPLNGGGRLIEESFKRHLNDQARNGVDGILVAGTMGLMPCLTAATYLRCVQVAVTEINGKMKIKVGVGDNSIERTIERILSIKHLKIDAVVATTPFYFTSSQYDLLYYFTEIAENSPFPVYLYDLPQRTKVKIELETVLRSSQHKNIKGIKCSDDSSWTKKLFDKFPGRDFEVISAHYDSIGVLLEYGMKLHLDGFFSIMPSWLGEIKAAFSENDFEKITHIQKKMTWLRNEFIKIGVFPAFTEAMNLLGFEGSFHPSHLVPLGESLKPRVRKLLEESGLLR